MKLLYLDLRFKLRRKPASHREAIGILLFQVTDTCPDLLFALEKLDQFCKYLRRIS